VKILFTADLHIKLGQKGVPLNWAKNRYNLLFDKLVKLQSQVDLVVLGGDIFDKLPSMEELEVYFELVSMLNKPTIIYSGNHEALKKSTTFLSNLRVVTRLINNNVIIIDDYYSYSNIDFIPYNKLKEYELKEIIFTGDILCTHVRGDIPPHVKAEVNLNIFNKWKIVLAGDLHSYENSQRNILYPGSPVTTSFHRSRVDTGIIILDADTLQHEFIKLDLPQLIRKTIQVGEPMPQTDYDHTVYEVEGDMSELANMGHSELLDKKVVKRSNDTALILEPTMTIAEELEEYLRYILNLNDSAIVNILKEFNNDNI
jgi:DNA repair exonuclease SbcCD nuclease subunit